MNVVARTPGVGVRGSCVGRQTSRGPRPRGSALPCFRVWQRKGYDMNIWTAKKVQEKLNYMHNNPVKRGLVKEPGDWPWSSWRFYFLQDTSRLAMDRVP